jgi:hypothetical protein
MAKPRKSKLKKPHSTPSPGRRRLKVFKTPIGFHDAYVAAPSRKAALAAWGAGTDLFAAGIAELETEDSPGAKAALAKPGEVVRVARSGGKGSGPLPRSASRSRPLPQGERGRKRKPSRVALDKAEEALAALEAAQAEERAVLAQEEERLAKRRRALEEKQRKAITAAGTKRDAAKERYWKALREWGG